MAIYIITGFVLVSSLNIMHMEPPKLAQVEGGVPGMGVLIDNRPHRARAGAARKRAAPSAWLSAGANRKNGRRTDHKAAQAEAPSGRPPSPGSPQVGAPPAASMKERN